MRAVAIRRMLLLVVVLGLTACSSSGNKPKPAELKPFTPQVAARQVWVSPIGPSSRGLSMAIHPGQVVVASGSGTVASVDPGTGQDVWRLKLDAGITAGVGSDGHMTAVVTDRNDLVAMVAGKEVWRQRLGTAVFTTPLVAGQRVFVLGGDRSVAAYDGNTGARLWLQTRSGEALVLRHSGVLQAFGDTLLAGLAGRLVAFNPNTGAVRWEAPVAVARGINDIERMVDLVGPTARNEDDICVRAFQSAVGCVDARRGVVRWTQSADGAQGVHADERAVFGVERNGKVLAWQRRDGQRLWANEQLLHRDLTAPLVLGRSVVVGDGLGVVHLLSRDDGHLTGRLLTDGSPVVTGPGVSGDTLLVMTRNGNLFAWRPQ